MPVDFNSIKTKRERARLTMDEAAIRAGYTGKRAPRSWWNDVESGKTPDPRISTLERVAAALKCKVDDLLVPG